MLHITGDNHAAPSRWADVVKQGGYLTPMQREAFERAIGLVREQLNAVLSRRSAPYRGKFAFDAFVDSLEPDFLHQAEGRIANDLHSDAAQTAFWIARRVADNCIALRRQ
ncbi:MULTISPECIES: DNA-binding protein [unclassified Brenneria]|uniref:DNA-binding protein n=1 Tax=unclassified Brenneria TaxID=2634434 RepID=UPI0015525E4F|nr:MULTISPECIES: DNA-binding protein [unclassified Brenneria]MBJ7220879.1 DNA-binding protein [Brenneria sp. L3-3C-1]MEE3642118.1 DNA-binding protein [Brenneria sp. L3_3C_1]MEE3649183.1 DNA-binding protein [Brenneria sp. HEZEL_4_2_4]NPC99138.1 DNA-binding protein [Brenneria sp. hezel4-2-4]